MKNKKEKKIMILLFLVFIVLFLLAFMTTFPNVLPLYQLKLFTINPTFYGITLNIIMLILCVISCIGLIFDYKQNNLVSCLIVLNINILYFIPGFLMNMIYDTDRYFINYYAMFWIFFICTHKCVVLIGKKKATIINFKTHMRSYQWFYNTGIVVIFCSFILLISLYYNNGHISISNLFDLDEVLKSREMNAERNIHWIIWYPIMCASMILPIWFSLAFKNKKYWINILIIITVFAMYSIGANRAYIFMLAFAVAFSVCKDDDLLLLKIMIIALIIVCVENYINSGYPVMNVVRRLTVTPNGESRLYVNFFENNTADWSKQLLERWLHPIGINSIYSLRISTVIGNEFLNGSNCNNGLVGYAIANYGTLGILIGPLLYAISFRLIDIIMNKVSFKKMQQVTAIVLALQIINSFGWTEYLIVPSFLLLFYLLMLFMPAIKKD